MKKKLFRPLLKCLLAFVALLSCTQIIVAQTVVKGKIIDGGTGEVLVGATVVIKGTTTGAQTDYDGLFTFTVPQAPPFTLQNQ